MITLIYPKSYSFVVVGQCRTYIIRKASRETIQEYKDAQETGRTDKCLDTAITLLPFQREMRRSGIEL